MLFIQLSAADRSVHPRFFRSKAQNMDISPHAVGFRIVLQQLRLGWRRPCTTHVFHALAEISLCISLLLLLVHLVRVLVVLAVCIQQLVPPSEGGSVVAHKVHVMEVVETAAGVERDQVERVPGDVVTAWREEEECNSIF